MVVVSNTFLHCSYLQHKCVACVQVSWTAKAGRWRTLSWCTCMWGAWKTLFNSTQSTRNILAWTLQPGKGCFLLSGVTSVAPVLSLSYNLSILPVFLLFSLSGCVLKFLYLLISCCRWTACSMTGLSPLRKAASTRGKPCMSRVCPTGLQPTSGPTARPWG